ncbi:MAG: hypothetical protein V4736_12040 [Bdellovibrionota bacterium]
MGMGFKSNLFGLVCFLAGTANAAVGDFTSLWQKSIPFFRSQESTFISGEASPRDLEKRVISTKWDLRFDVSKDGKRYLLNDDELGFDIQFARKATMTRSFRFQGNEISKDKKVDIEKHEGLWSRILFGDQAMWVPTQLLEAAADDMGLFRTLRDTPLKKDPSFNSYTLTRVPSLTEFVITQWKNDWLQVRWKNQLGYIHSQDLIGRPDFAKWAFVQGRGWVKVKFRVGSQLQTEDMEKIPLSLIRGYKPFVNRAMVIKQSEGAPPLRSIVQMEARRTDRWNLSLLDFHGPVWWKANVIASSESMDISYDDLLKRNIFAFDYKSGAKPLGLISSDGIYQSADGKSWKKLATFGDQNFPVAVDPAGPLYVGSFRSDDNGKTFEPYIKWEKVYSTLQDRLNRQPPVMRLVGITPAKNSVEILVDTGIRRMKLRSSSYRQDWQVVN